MYDPVVVNDQSIITELPAACSVLAEPRALDKKAFQPGN
jgi:hypothetical protein